MSNISASFGRPLVTLGRYLQEINPITKHFLMLSIVKAILLTSIIYLLYTGFGAFVYFIYPKTSIIGFVSPINSIFLFIIDVLIMVLVLWYFFKVETLNKVKQQMAKSKLSDYFIGIAIGILTVLLLTSTTKLYFHIFSLGEFEFRSGHLQFELFHILDLISYAIIGPIFEEIIFRGHIQKKLESEFNSIIAIIISSFLFGIYHAPEWIQVWTSTIFAILAGGIYAKTKNIVTPIMWHITWNGLIVFSKYFDIF